MKIQNQSDLLKKKNALKQIISIQEEQLRDNVVARTFSKAKALSDTVSQKFPHQSTTNPLVEKSIDLALTTLSARTLQSKKMGMVSKLAIGLGIIVLGKIISNKLESFTDEPYELDELEDGNWD